MGARKADAVGFGQEKEKEVVVVVVEAVGPVSRGMEQR